MNLSEKYWLTVLLMFCRYLSILMIASGSGFIALGYLINRWFYLGLIIWPLMIMWGVVNIRYIQAFEKHYKVGLNKILESIS